MRQMSNASPARRRSGERVRRTPFFLCLLLTAGGAFLSLLRPAVVEEHLETLLVDYRFKIRNLLAPPVVPTNIVIVAVDEKSLSTHGRWPWARTLQARLIERVFQGHPKVVAVDIFFPEAESPQADSALAEVFAEHSARLVVALGYEVKKGKKQDGEIEDVLYEQAITRIERVGSLRPIEAFRVLLPPDPIAGSVVFGHVYALPDRDGNVRWEDLYIRYGDEYFACLPLQAARIYGGYPPDKLRIIGGTGVELGSLVIPTDDYGRLHINYIGKEHRFPYCSAADVLSGQTPAERFEDKAVFIGTSAIATYDLISTPFSANMPGVEKNATVLANILGRSFIRRCPLFLELLVLLIAGLSVATLCTRLRAAYAFGFFLFLLFALLAANQGAFTWCGIRANLSYPLLTVTLEGIAVFSYRHLVEERRARGIRRLFSNYVTERVVHELINNPELAKLGGTRKEVTILFSDIRGFTLFSEQNEPEYVVAMLNDYLGAMSDVISRWEGTLDKYVGDAIIAFWGAPLNQEDHAELALRCALHMMQRLETLQNKWRAEGKEPLDSGIGINTGEVVVGNIGAEGKKMDYTVIGDHVNLCERTEQLTRKYNARIVITEFTLNKIRPLISARQFGHMSVKGLEKVPPGRRIPL